MVVAAFTDSDAKTSAPAVVAVDAAVVNTTTWIISFKLLRRSIIMDNEDEDVVGNDDGDKVDSGDDVNPCTSTFMAMNRDNSIILVFVQMMFLIATLFAPADVIVIVLIDVDAGVVDVDD